ncbi:MAG: ATP-grasp domain-containing protein [Thiotrichales bacterium]
MAPDALRGGARLVYGGGLERHPAALEPWREAGRLYGNTPAVVTKVNDPKTFFPLLDRLGIDHPAVRWREPTRGDWLIKRAGASGGGHVRRWRSGVSVRAGEYWQRHVAGQAVSVLFLANRRAVRIIGYNTLFQLDGGFAYAGAINRAELTHSRRAELAAVAQALTLELGLVGLNGIDFIAHHDGCLLLELNPRPSATFELYDEDFMRGLMFWHLQACRGRLYPTSSQGRNAVRLRKILFVKTGYTVPPGLNWPDWVRDIPQPGVTIGADEPLCTIAAAGSDAAAVLALARQRELTLVGWLDAARRAA